MSFDRLCREPKKSQSVMMVGLPKRCSAAPTQGYLSQDVLAPFLNGTLLPEARYVALCHVTISRPGAASDLQKHVADRHLKRTLASVVSGGVWKSKSPGALRRVLRSTDSVDVAPERRRMASKAP